MSDEKPPKETGPHRATGKSHADVRAAALEKALRDNLRRRKAAQAEANAPSDGDASEEGAAKSLHEKAKEIPGDGA